MTQDTSALQILGWREWVALPDLSIPLIKAKVDTGAKTSALHAFVIDPYRKGGEQWVMFAIHPEQLQTANSIECHVKVKDRRLVTDSGGHAQQRYVIETPIILGNKLWLTEMTLTNRDTMRFRMLLGRGAMRGRFLVNPKASYCQGLPHHTG